MRLSRAMFAQACLLLVLHIVYVKSVENVTIDAAAVTRDGSLCLFSGDKVMLVYGTAELDVGDTRTLFGTPPGMKIQAAFVTYDNDKKMLFYGDTYGYFVELQDYGNIARSRRLKYGPKRKFLQQGGPDAAMKRDGVVYFFKGCQVSKRSKWDQWSEAENYIARGYGLPCHLDAAWSYGENSILLRGDQFWVWHSNNTVEGPTPFHDLFEVSSWRLKPFVPLETK